MGFVLEDGKSECSPVAHAHSILREKPNNEQVIKRFVGGDDLNSDPNLLPDRYIIDFSGLNEAEARNWPDAFEIVENMVNPGRMALTSQSGAKSLKRTWWQFAFQAKELANAKRDLERVLATSQTSKYRAFAFLPAKWVFDQKVVVFAESRSEFFCIIQSRVHEAWSLFFGSTMKDDPVYTPSDCFETFPFPPDWETNEALELAGREYYEYRAALMVRNDEGLTKTYNRFHDPEERSPDIHQLRTLHAAMDRAVLAAYGWPDIPTACEFLLDYEEDEDSEDAPEAPGKKKGKKKKKPYRYRWPDEVRDEVLAKLLALNAERAEQEKLSGTTGKKTTRKSKTEFPLQREKAGDEMV
jgi:hypothetical protein